MRFVIDMNLSPAWCEVLSKQGWEAVHWSDVGDRRTPDEDIMRWARERDFVVFTHDLDFGAILAASGADSPSVLQIRALDVMPEALGRVVVQAITQFSDDLQRGALITVEPLRSRARILPIRGT